MINHFNFQRWDQDILITNDIGHYCFLSKPDFLAFCSDCLDKSNPKYKELVSKDFLLEDHPFIASLRVAENFRRSRMYLQHATTLFMFVLTNQCNMHCQYCQVQTESNKTTGKMNREIAKHAMDIVLQSPCKEIMIEFQGGEPLLNFELIPYVVDYLEKNNTSHKIDYSIVTNSSLLTPEIIDFFSKHEISVSLSLDGDKSVQDNNRPMNNGQSNYDYVLRNVDELKKHEILAGAVMTTTRFSLSKHKEIIDTYIDLGFDDIFIRPLSPLGFAREHWAEIGYTPKEFEEFYSKCLDYILDKNKAGITIRENHANLFLTKIVHQQSENYMELRSPCGAVVGQMAFNYDGNIYTCDEGRMLAQMGKEVLKIGNVYESSFSDLVKNPVCKTMCKASILESIPGCCECVYMPYCGVCPATTYVIENDIMTRTYHNYRCATYKGILDTIFKNMRIPENRAILESWSSELQ